MIRPMIEVLALSTVNGLPAHILLNHVVVVLGPLAAILAVLCAVWPAARRRLIWQVLLLAAGTLVAVPLTTDSGGWLAGQVGGSQVLHQHAHYGDTLIYYVGALVAAVALLAAVHVRQRRDGRIPMAVHVLVGVLVLAAAGGTLYRTYLVGDSGARAAWGDVASTVKSSGP
jgi:hypothetical protein